MMVFGGGAQASSDSARWDEANMAWPHIVANPVTGHGVGMAAQVIGYTPAPGGAGFAGYMGSQYTRRHGCSWISFLFQRHRLRLCGNGAALCPQHRSQLVRGLGAGFKRGCLRRLSARFVTRRKSDAVFCIHGPRLHRRQNRCRPRRVESFTNQGNRRRDFGFISGVARSRARATGCRGRARDDIIRDDASLK